MNVALAPSMASATSIVKPEHSEEKTKVTDASGDERLLCGRRGAGSLNPEADEQIRREPDEFPKHEKEKQTVRDNQPEHRSGEKRQVRKEAGEIFIVGHVADAEDKDAQADGRDHYQHRCRQRVENKPKPQRLVAESEPGEILHEAKPVRLQREQERYD
jgi:hypothetical protein